MKKVILGLLVVLTSCHSSSVKVEVNEDSVLKKYKLDTVKVDSIKVVDSIKSK